MVLYPFITSLLNYLFSLLEVLTQLVSPLCKAICDISSSSSEPSELCLLCSELADLNIIFRIQDQACCHQS